LAELETLARAKISELVQTYLILEVDELLERARYVVIPMGACEPPVMGTMNRTVTTTAGLITIRRPRVRNVVYESKILPKYRRCTSSIGRTMHELSIEGLADRDFERSPREVILLLWAYGAGAGYDPNALRLL
jgi:transposase-like protein